MSTCHLVVDSPVDELTLVSDGTAVRALYFAEHRHAPAHSALGQRVHSVDAPPVLTMTATQLSEYFAGERTTFDLPLDPVGTDFQQRVWRALRQIPYAQTRGYGELAASIGARGAARAVGAANGRNPLSVIVPCHRVIGADGSLTGYGGGAQRKQALLDLERRVAGVSLW